MSKAPISILTSLVSQNGLTADNFRRELDAAKVRNAKANKIPLNLPDGGGLLLHITPAGSRIWRYRFRLNGGQQILTIGNYPEISLSDARQAHRGARWLVERGTHPLEYINEEIDRIEAEERLQQMSTFAAVCKAWHQATEMSVSSRTAAHRKSMLEKHILPIIGKRPINEIKRRELADLLLPIDREFPVLARHCRQYVKMVFDWAIELELVQGNPTPASKILSNQKSHEAIPRKALPFKRMGEFLRTLSDAPDTDHLTKAALRLLILTWCRTSEVIGALWGEFDLATGTWLIPADRMKSNEPHTVYLSTQAIKILEELYQLTGRGKFLFPNQRNPDDHMARTTLFQWRARHGFKNEMDIHGFRSVASTWANNSGRFRPDVVEVALAHKEADRIRAAYNRAQYIEELRALWQDWADALGVEEADTRA